MKNKIIISIGLLVITINGYSQNSKPVAAEPSIAQPIIAAPQIPAEAKTEPANTFTKPNMDLQLKASMPKNNSTTNEVKQPEEKVEPVVLKVDNSALPATTIDTNIDDNKYYKTDEKLKPKQPEIAKPTEQSKTPQQTKPNLL